ncbi:unnamed protein product [Symbiodinium sp. CCMP2592]|nr:unnamed protein product [Symbiodinium sp. CCMP2592]
MAQHVVLPPILHQVALEERLLLTQLRQLLEDWTSHIIPPSLTTSPRNDIVAFACQRLPESLKSRFLTYADTLATALPMEGLCVSLPPPYGCVHSSMHDAEALAWHALNTYSGQPWTLARLLLPLLPLEPDERAHGTGLTLNLGLYVKGGIHGYYKYTKLFPNVCRVLNMLIMAVYPGHKWSALTLGVDNRTLPHKDRWNSDHDSLLVGLSHHLEGGLWVERENGKHFEECDDDLRPGDVWETAGHAILFPGRTHWHSTLPWTGGNRVVLIAYAPGHIATVQSHQIAHLVDLGFVPPAV